MGGNWPEQYEAPFVASESMAGAIRRLVGFDDDDSDGSCNDFLQRAGECREGASEKNECFSQALLSSAKNSNARASLPSKHVGQIPNLTGDGLMITVFSSSAFLLAPRAPDCQGSAVQVYYRRDSARPTTACPGQKRKAQVLSAVCSAKTTTSTYRKEPMGKVAEKSNLTGASFAAVLTTKHVACASGA